MWRRGIQQDFLSFGLTSCWTAALGSFAFWQLSHDIDGTPRRLVVDSLIEAREQTEASGCELDIELTESVLMENVESVVPKLQTLSGLGVRIAVDDFGTGYSSLAYISRLPIHAIKIDRSFVAGMTQDQNSLTIVKTTIALAHSLGLKVIAEGVETAEQAELLATLECDEMQGYYFSPPVPPGEVGGVLRALSRS